MMHYRYFVSIQQEEVVMRTAIIWSMGIMALGCRSEEGIKVYNSLPVAEITSHADGHAFVEGESVSFIATISDANHDEDELW